MGLWGFRDDPVQMCGAQRYRRALAGGGGRSRKARSTNTAKSLRYLQRGARLPPLPRPLTWDSEGRRVANYSGIPEQVEGKVFALFS